MFFHVKKLIEPCLMGPLDLPRGSLQLLKLSLPKWPHLAGALGPWWSAPKAPKAQLKKDTVLLPHSGHLELMEQECSPHWSSCTASVWGLHSSRAPGALFVWPFGCHHCEQKNVGQITIFSPWYTFLCLYKSTLFIWGQPQKHQSVQKCLPSIFHSLSALPLSNAPTQSILLKSHPASVCLLFPSSV